MDKLEPGLRSRRYSSGVVSPRWQAFMSWDSTLQDRVWSTGFTIARDFLTRRHLEATAAPGRRGHAGGYAGALEALFTPLAAPRPGSHVVGRTDTFVGQTASPVSGRDALARDLG